MESWAIGRLTAEAEEEAEEIDADRIKACIQELGGGGQRVEAAVLDRSLPTKTKFRLLSAEELEVVTGAR